MSGRRARLCAAKGLRHASGPRCRKRKPLVRNARRATRSSCGNGSATSHRCSSFDATNRGPSTGPSLHHGAVRWKDSSLDAVGRTPRSRGEGRRRATCEEDSHKTIGGRLTELILAFVGMTGAQQRPGMNRISVAMQRAPHPIDSSRMCGVTINAVARGVPSLPLGVTRTAGSNSGSIRVRDRPALPRCRREAATISVPRSAAADRHSIGIKTATTITTNRSTLKSRAACGCPSA